MIYLDLAERPPQYTHTATQSKGFSTYRTGLYTFSYQLVLNVFSENLKQIFLEMKLRGLVPNSNIRDSGSDLYIPTIDLPVLLQIDRGNI
jgi:hypothetical protein